MGVYLDGQPTNKFNRQGSVIDKTALIFSDGARVNYTLAFTVNSGSTSIAFSDSAAVANSMDVYHIRINDEHGNEATGNLDPASPSTTVNVSVSGLVKTDDWVINVVVIKGRGGDSPQSFQSYPLEIEGNKGSLTGTINEFQSAGTINVKVSATKNGVELFALATVADGGTQSVGSAVVGDDVIAFIQIQNTSAVYPYKVTSITLTGDATVDSSIFLPAVVAPSFNNEGYQIKFDTATTGSPKAAVVTIVNTTTNVSYQITLQLTVA